MQKRFSQRGIWAAALALTLVAVAGCTSDSGGDEDTTAAGGGALEKVVYLTSFGNFGRDSYAHVAKEKGFFRDAGFDVEIKPGAGTGKNIQSVVTGQALFTPIDLTGGLLTAGGPQKTTGFVGVSAIQQRTMAAVMTTEDKGITGPKDLEGKTLADLPGSVVRNLFPTYAKLAGVDYEKVKWVNGAPETLMGTLASGQVDGIGQFVVGKPTLEGISKGKKKAVLLPYSDYLQDLYGNVLITSTKYAEENPEKTKAFAAALLKGLDYSLKNPAEAGQILQKAEATANPDSAAAELTLMAPYVGTADQMGTLDAQRVARSIAILQGSGQIAAGLTPEAVINFDLAAKA